MLPLIFADGVEGLRDVLNLRCDLSDSDVYMKGLLEKMPDYLIASKSSSTTKKYQSYFNKFKIFMSEHNKSYLPASDMNVALFVVHLLNNNSSHSVITSCVYGIKWMHNLFGYKDPTVTSHIKDLLSTSNRRVVAKSSGKKDVISSNCVKDLFIKYSDSTDLFVVRDLVMIVTCFAGFLRYDELSNIRCNEISFHENYVKIVISKSKTDQFREGNEVLLSKLDSMACPFEALSRYVTLANIDLSSSNFLFRGIYKTKLKSALRDKAKKLSYTRTKEVIISRLKEVVPKGLNLGLHSLRASGVTAAANAGVNERCFKRHGRWRSDAVHGYIKDTVNDRLAVTQNLGL